MTLLNQLQATTDLRAEGRENADIGVGYPSAVPTGWYLVSLDRVGALGPIPKKDTRGAESKIVYTEQIKIGFTILKAVSPAFPESLKADLIKTYQNNETGATEQVPYTVDVGGDFNVRLSKNSKAQLASIAPALRGALPVALQKQLRAEGKSISEAFPTIKSMFGQQFIVFIQKTDNGKPKDKGFREENQVFFSADKIEDFTAKNEAAGTPQQLTAGIMAKPMDNADVMLDIEPQTAMPVVGEESLLFDIDAADMTQLHLDSAARKKVFVGSDCLPNDNAPFVEYCAVLAVNYKLGKYADFQFGKLVKEGKLTIPAPTPKKDTDSKDAPDTNFNDTAEVAAPQAQAPAPVEATVEAAPAAVAVADEFAL